MVRNMVEEIGRIETENSDMCRVYEKLYEIEKILISFFLVFYVSLFLFLINLYLNTLRN